MDTLSPARSSSWDNLSYNAVILPFSDCFLILAFNTDSFRDGGAADRPRPLVVLIFAYPQRREVQRSLSPSFSK